MKRLLALVLTMGIAFSLLAGCTQNANNGDENGGNTGNKEWKIGLIAAGTFGDNGLNDALKRILEFLSPVWRSTSSMTTKSTPATSATRDMTW